MNKQLLLLLILLPPTLHSGHAQAPLPCPNNNTPGADLCRNACIYADLSGYSGTTAGYTDQAPQDFCGTNENEQWFCFIAAEATAVITAIPSNCTSGNGIQLALYSDCNSAPIPCGCSGGEAQGGNTPVSLSVNLAPGNVYYLMIDGYAGDLCDFTLSLEYGGIGGFLTDTREIKLCSGQSFVVNDIPYAAPATVMDTLYSTSGDCDTIVTYNLTTLLYVEETKTVQFCPGDTVVINGIAFDEPGTYVDLVTTVSGGCDTLVTYVLQHLSQVVLYDTIVFQPGTPVFIGGNAYYTPGMVTHSIPAVPAGSGCDSLILYTLLADLSVPDTCLSASRFLKNLGEQGIFETGNVICPAADGNLYIAGEKGEHTLLMKVTRSGTVLWSRRFMPLAPLALHITDLLEDSGGMLTGCGIVGEGDINLKSYAFRYDPSAGVMLWAKVLQQESPEVFTITEKNPGGNFLLLSSPQLTLNVDDAEIWELNRNTGAVVNGLTRRYHYGISDVFTSMVVHNGAIYATGRHIPTLGPFPPLAKMRMGLSKLDLSTGIPIWSRLSHLDTNVVAFLGGHDLLIHDEAIFTLYSGPDSAISGIQQAFFLQKNTLDGDLLWVKRYNLPGKLFSEAHDILSTSDGFVLVGSTEEIPGEFEKTVVKTDFDGNVLWAQSLASSIPVSAGFSFYNGNHAAIVVNDTLFLTGVTVGISSDMLLVKMTADGRAGENCALLKPLNVQWETVPDPLNMPFPLTFIPSIRTLANNSAAFSAANMPVATYCVSCLPVCDSANTSLSMDCPDNIDIPAGPGGGSVAVNYNLPAAASDCECPGLALTLTQGLPPGGLFPPGLTTVCYAAKDSCGNTASCCFEVFIREEQPCDVKTTGCMKYELLSITQDATAKKTYRIRVTNNCNNPLTYTAIQLPNSMTAKKPLNNTIYTAPGGRQYLVRNPNYAPFWSIRFKSTTDSISGGESDIFEYTLPAQAQPAFIHITSRLEPQVYYEAHLNTFYCPVNMTSVNRGDDSLQQGRDTSKRSLNLRVFPNPTTGLLYADLSIWAGEEVRIQMFNSQGQRIQLLSVPAIDTPQEILLPEGLANGLYFLEALPVNGEKRTARFVIHH